jgi:N-acetylmuramoyl-L-alanine amidase
MGTECLYISQHSLSDEIAHALSACGFINRGAKKRTDLYFLNQTEMPSILIEVCFVDSTADANIYDTKFDEICEAIATVLGGKEKVIGV